MAGGVKKSLRKIQRVHLVIIFALVIIISGVILGILALRAIEREEAYIEKNFELTLSSEVANAVSIINTELRAIQDELADILTVPDPTIAAHTLKTIQQESPLVGLPFMVSSQQVVIYPQSSEPLSEEEALLIDQNKELLQNDVSIPVYKNIVKEYKQEILNEQIEEDESELIADDNSGPRQNNPEARENQPNAEGSKPNEALQEEIETQQAITRFNRSEPLREKIYKQAQEQGRQILVRNIILPEGREDSLNRQWSFFILESRTFSQITEKGTSGIIPRFIEDKFYLLYWEKDDNGSVAGCVIDNTSLKQRLLKVIPPMYSETRILVILNEKAAPLLIPEGEEQREWYKPFTAKEISELLPRWEVAAYLTNPDIIKDKARAAALVLWILIGFLVIALFLGGTFITVLLVNEMKLAQQKTGFVANVSHELKTPLTSIRLFAELLRDNRQPDKSKRKNYLDIMVSETERLTRLINNVLDFTRMGKDKMNYNREHADIRGLCRDIIEAQRARLEHKGFTLKIKCPATAVFVNIDQEAFKQVLINLLANAEKYAKRKKSIKVKVETEIDHVKISIMDRGPGIPLKFREKIFKEFFRIDDSLSAPVTGSGLGLSISRKILRDHGGDIIYLARDGGGSNFQIILPRGE
ncbi:MAG: HAMP domain-containing histidine kinase [Spirochaetales bacterium]|nr:HAMP domain-containing histidine kinase [Spirochaetales bacterium]